MTANSDEVPEFEFSPAKLLGVTLMELDDLIASTFQYALSYDADAWREVIRKLREGAELIERLYPHVLTTQAPAGTPSSGNEVARAGDDLPLPNGTGHLTLPKGHSDACPPH